MKKVISMALACVLMLVTFVPAFALDMAVTSGSTPVKVKGASAGATFTVTIPATATLTWGQEEKAVEYSVSSQLATGSYIKVSVKADSDYKMKNADASAYLEYSLKSGTTEYTTTKSVISAASPEKSSVVVQIPSANWDKASIDNYTGTLTFEAVVV